MAMVRWDPFLGWRSSLLPELTGMQRTFERLTRDFFEGWPAWEPAAERRTALFAPVDVLTRGDDLVVRAELPGMDPEKDIEVSVQNGMVSIRGERRQEQTHDGDGYFRVERSYGSFARTIALPEGITEADIEANYNQGVLEVVVHGGARNAQAHRIPVKVGLAQKVKKALGVKSEAKERDAKPSA